MFLPSCLSTLTIDQVYGMAAPLLLQDRSGSQGDGVSVFWLVYERRDTYLLPPRTGEAGTRYVSISTSIRRLW